MEDSKSPNYIDDFCLKYGLATRALHAGEHVGQPQHASHTGAIYQCSTFVFENVDQGARLFSGQEDGYVYTRLGNPTVLLLEAKMNALEGREVKLADPDVRVSSLAFSSGMAAISGTLMGVCGAGDTVLMGDVVYGATQHLAANVLTRFGIRTVLVNTSDLGAVAEALETNPEPKVVFLETPTNPTLQVTDISAVTALVKKASPETVVVVDNPFATPALQRPLNLGADVVVHSTTKYLSGHGTVVGGIMTTTRDDVKERAYTIIKDVGGSPSPFDAWLVNNGVKTLPLRMERHCSNAMTVAQFLDGHEKVERVYYPGLPDSPFHDLANRQMSGRFGGMVACEVVGGLAAGRKLMDTIQIFTLAVSLGWVDSLIQHPASMTHACVPRETRLAAGLPDGLVRISVGIEDVEDLVGALSDALARI